MGFRALGFVKGQSWDVFVAQGKATRLRPLSQGCSMLTCKARIQAEATARAHHLDSALAHSAQQLCRTEKCENIRPGASWQKLLDNS